MATFTVTTDTNIDALAGKTGGDVYNVNGAKLTIDQDSRYGVNQSTSTSLANMTISATLGGEIHIDGSNIRLIPYDGGAGNVPALNTVISGTTGSGKLLGVYSSLTVAPTASGAAMPATGFIKIKQWNGNTFGDNETLTGLTATVNGTDTVGWLEIIGDEAGTCTVPRLGTFRVTGAWYVLGDTNGAANQQFQIPSHGLLQYIPGVFIEKSVGSDDYEFYPNAASQTTVATDIRAKVCWISTAGLVRIGHNGTANAGFVPVTGLKVRIPNIIFQNCTTAARTANALPNATLATRYDFTTTGGGVLDIDKALMTWYPSFAQAFSVELSNFAYNESMSITECASTVVLDTVGCGQTAAQAQVGLVLGLCFAGVTMTDCHFSRATLAASGAYTSTITDCEEVNCTNVSFTALTVKGNATSGNVLATRMNNSDWSVTKLTNGRIVLVTCTNVNITTTSYADVITGTTNTTAAQNSYVFELQSNCNNVVMSGIDFFGLTNVQAYLGLLNIAAAGCTKIRLRSVGTRATPLSLGSTNGGAFAIVLAAGAAANDVKCQRVYVSNTRSGYFSCDNSSTKFVIENCAGDFADNSALSSLNSIVKALASTQTLGATTANYGSHFQDFFTSATAGRIGITMNEATALTSSQVTLSNGAKFTSAGGLYMPTIGMIAEFEMPYFALGHTSFQNSAAVMAGGTIGNYTLEYQIDKNNGSGYNGTWKTLNGTNLSGETGIDASLGVKLKIRITTSTTNSTAITSLYVLTNSTAVAQDNQYPLDVVTITLTGLKTNSEIRAYLDSAGANGAEIAGVESSGTSFSFSATAGSTINIMINNLSYLPADIWGYVVGSSDVSIPVSQFVDRNFLNP